MPRRVPAAIATEDILEVEDVRYIVVARDRDHPHLLHRYNPDTAEESVFDTAEANLNGTPWQLVRDRDQVAGMAERLLALELIRDPRAKALAESRLAIVEDIRAHRHQLLILARAERAAARARRRAHDGSAPPDADDVPGGAASDGRSSRSHAARQKLEAYCVTEHGISSSTYYRWERRLLAAGGNLVALLDDRDPPQAGGRSVSARAGARLTDKQLALVTWAYENHYRHKPNKDKSLKHAHLLLVQRAKATGEAPVGLGTLWAIFGGVEAGQRRPNGEAPILIRRTKADEAEESRAYYETIWNTATMPGQYVFEDSHKLDIRGLDFHFRLPTMRLWLHALFDAYSRCVPGLYLTVRGPSTQTLQIALMHAIFPRDFASEFGIAAAHPHMCAQHLILDNAWGGTSFSFRAACNDIGQYGVNPITLIFRPPYDARRGALIERFFGTLETQLIHHLPGTTLSHPRALGDYNPAEHATLLFEDILGAIVRWLDIYHNTPRVELGGRTPLQRYQEGAARLGRMPEPQDSRARYLFRVRHPEARVVDKKGFKLFGLRYNAPCLVPFRSTHKTQDRPRIHVGYDEEDIRRVSAFADGRYSVCRRGALPEPPTPPRGVPSEDVAPLGMGQGSGARGSPGWARGRPEIRDPAHDGEESRTIRATAAGI